jgi:hypothetical protein
MANQNTSKTGDSDKYLDDLVRRELRVGDPKNAVEIAQALLNLYPEEKLRLERENIGLPFVSELYQVVSDVSPEAEGPIVHDFTQVKADLEQDLTELISSPALRSVAPGLRGWSQALRTAVSEGFVAARLALDPGKRNKVFGIRRILGDYARLARFVGVLNIESNFKYRRLARSIDQLASLIFVRMGEALSKQAMSGFLLQVPLGEIQSRRAGVVLALRSLLGSIETAYDDESWGRGRIGYRELYEEITCRNQPDLKVLLQESELSRMMDELVDGVARNTADGLSALGATAEVTIEKMQRLLVIGVDISQVDPQPPLVAFLQALRLFVDSFVNNRVGLRVVEIARPPITFYGSRFAFGQGADAEARANLFNLVFARGQLADALDDYLQDEIDGNINVRIQGQILLDKILYDVDRAIDLYAQGTENWGNPERRAVAYAILLSAFTGEATDNLQLHAFGDHEDNVINSLREFVEGRDDLDVILGNIQGYLSPPEDAVMDPGENAEDREILFQEFNTQSHAENRWRQLVQAVVPSNFP